MTNTLEPHRSQSFQNCKETDIPGYNDCPSFLFNVSKKTGRKHKLHTAVQDTYGSTKLPVTPPPMSIKKATILPPTKTPDTQDKPPKTNPTPPVTDELSESKILDKINTLLNRNSNLSDKEYQFYKKKVDLNLPKSITNSSTRISLSQFLEIVDNKSEQAEFLRKWMIMDITISNWCPAFLKLIENVAE